MFATVCDGLNGWSLSIFNSEASGHSGYSIGERDVLKKRGISKSEAYATYLHTKRQRYCRYRAAGRCVVCRAKSDSKTRCAECRQAEKEKDAGRFIAGNGRPELGKA